MSELLVEVRPLEVKKWHGKEGEESFTRTKKIQALVNASTMMYETGLTEDEAKEYGEKIGQDLSPQYDTEKPHSFWDSTMAVIKLENNTIFFNQKNTIDKIRVKIMKASKFVANSQREYEEGKFPEATHVIYDEKESKEVKASKIETKNKAIIECSKLSKTKKIQIIMILDDKNLKNQTDEFVTVALDELIEKKASEVLRHINMDADKLSNHSLVLEALQKNILRKEGVKILYFDSVMGSDVHDVINYVSNPENQDFKIKLLDAINN